MKKKAPYIVIALLIAVVAVLVWQKTREPKTLGEKFGAVIEQAGDDLEDAAKDAKKQLNQQ